MITLTSYDGNGIFYLNPGEIESVHADIGYTKVALKDGKIYFVNNSPESVARIVNEHMGKTLIAAAQRVLGSETVQQMADLIQNNIKQDHIKATRG